MVIKPAQIYSNAIEMLESIGLIDVEITWSGGSAKDFNFKFPDGTAVTGPRFNKDYYSGDEVKLMYDLDAHILLVFSASSTPVADAALNKEVLRTILMFVMPSETGKLVYQVPPGTWGDAFNVCTDTVADAQPGIAAILLPAYAGTYGKYVRDLKDCYVSLNTVYAPCQKFVDETGAKWISLGGPLLYKVPTIE